MAPEALERFGIVAGEGVGKADPAAGNDQRVDVERSDTFRDRKHRGERNVRGDAMTSADLDGETPIGFLRVFSFIGHDCNVALGGGRAIEQHGNGGFRVRNTRAPTGTASATAFAMACGAEPSCSW